MVMTYSTLTGAKTVAGSIASWVNHSAVEAAAPSIVDEAESMIYRRLRHWRMLGRTTGVFTIGNDYIALSGVARYLEDKAFYITGVNFDKLTRKTEQEVIANYGYDASGARINEMPEIYYNDATNFWFDAPSDQAYPWLLTFYQQPVALSTSGTNFLTEYYPRLLRCACMIGASEFMKDAGLGNFDRTYWEQNALAEVAVAQQESDRAFNSIDVGAIIT